MVDWSSDRAEEAGPALRFPSRIRICSLEMTAVTFEEAVAIITNWAATERDGRVVCAANVHMLIEAHDAPEFAEELASADAVLPDGMPLVWLMRRRGASDQERVAGMDLLPALCASAAREGVRAYFLGSTPAVLDTIRARLANEYPALRIAGMESPPFRELSEVEEAALAERVNASGAGMVFVALGCPKQERWMHRNRGRIRAVMVGLGAAFPVYAGFQPRAPRGMQRMGLEWLHRLVNEPRRLWRRYLYTNAKFFWCLLIEHWRGVSPSGCSVEPEEGRAAATGGRRLTPP